MRVLVFDIWGDYAHFRKFYTTSSPLSFSFPPPSTLAGILGAICGAGKEEYLQIFAPDKCRLALKILKPVQKVRMGINHIDTKKSWLPKQHTQIRTEFLKDPAFRVYFAHQDDSLFEKTADLIKQHQSIFTVSLGLSELLADFNYVGVYEAQEMPEASATDISTPVTIGNMIADNLTIENNKKYFKENMPIVMNPAREIEKYDEIIFEAQGKTIHAQLKNYQRLSNGENITFFWV
ncbi:type I-B CRISPR-associated protein Cas5b [Caldithrix abyssi]